MASEPAPGCSYKRISLIHRKLGGLLLGLLAWAFPLTLFLGSEGLVVVTENTAELGVTLLIATFYAILNLLADLLQAFMDPRIRLS